METLSGRPLRADARRNREAILAAAKAVFAKHGPDAQMDDIARRAKLGVGTLYRHFPTKDALIAALLADRFRQIATFLEAALDDPDPLHGLQMSMWQGAELAQRDRGVSQLFGEQSADMAEVREAQARMISTAAELIRRAQAEGTLRADFHVGDIPVVMCGVVAAMHTMPVGPEAWQRHLRLIFAGMQARPDLEPL